MTDPWNFTEAQKRQFREAQAASKLRSEHRTAYRVIYAFGATEVAGIRLYDTREEAQAEADAADDPGLDLAWVEEVPS